MRDLVFRCDMSLVFQLIIL